MIEEIQISNVRLFDGPDEWRIPISPLSVFCGTNSSGKSTILKSLLLLCQTLSAAESGKQVGKLRFAGALIDLGSYRSFVSHNQTNLDILIGVTVRNFVESGYLEELEKARAPVAPILADSLIGYQQEYTLKARFRCGTLMSEALSEKFDSELTVLGEKGTSGQAFLKEAIFDFRSESGVLLSWKLILNRESHEYDILIPIDFFGMTHGFDLMDVVKDNASGQVQIETFMNGLIPTGLWARPKLKKGTDTDRPSQLSFFPLPPLIRKCCDSLRKELTQVHYLGPLRSPARRYYMTNLDVVPALDTAGEFLPYVLRDQRDQYVYYIPPRPGAEPVQTRLEYALNGWLYYLRTGQYLSGDDDQDLHEIDVASMKDVLLEFTLRSFGGEAHALADSGFGYSQILPIVVRGLIAEPGSTIVIEQPEVHLNPGLQVRLSEFLASLTGVGKCVLIETHSEHIVNSIRVLTAEDTTGRLRGKCRIFFLDTSTGTPLIRQLEILSDGTVPDWPRGFFGEALSLGARLLRAQDAKDEPPKSG